MEKVYVLHSAAEKAAAIGEAVVGMEPIVPSRGKSYWKPWLVSWVQPTKPDNFCPQGQIQAVRDHGWEGVAKVEEALARIALDPPADKPEDWHSHPTWVPVLSQLRQLWDMVDSKKFTMYLAASVPPEMASFLAAEMLRLGYYTASTCCGLRLEEVTE